MHTESTHQVPHDPESVSREAPTPDRRALLAGIGGLAAGALLAGARTAQAGPLNPPAGPVTSTGKTLTEVEPRTAINSTNTPGDAASVFRITQPGSYYLTGNIQGESGKHGLVIAANDVTIDLNGFVLLGVPGALDGILQEVGSTIAVVNGTVKGFRNGIDAGAATASARLSDVVCERNSSAGARLSNATVTRCRFAFNTGEGCRVGQLSEVIDCVSESNGVDGFAADGVSLFTNCMAVSNTGMGFRSLGNIVFSQCTAQSNANGFLAGGAASLRDCLATDNRQSGIVLSDPNASGVIQGCTSRFNGDHGIVVNNGVLVYGNTLFRNFAPRAGIRVTGSDNRIEANNSIRSGIGIEVVGTGNLIARNTCSGNSTANYSIVVGNAVAPILVAATNTAAINGSSYSGNLGSTDPNANFSY